MATATKQNRITEGVIWKQLLYFFLPILLGSFFQQLYTTVDAVIVGQFAGKEALAAIDATIALTRLFINLFVGIASGATILISQYHGAGLRDEVSRTAHTSIAFALVGGLVLTVIGVALSPYGTRLMQVPEDLSTTATTYLRVYSLGMIPSMVYNMGAGILRAIGDSKRPLYFLLIGSAANILLDLLFVAGFGWGVAGAAYATAISQALSMVLVMLSLARAKHDCRITLGRIRFDMPIIREIMRKGLPIGVQSAMYPISNMIIHARINLLGTNVIAAWAICGKLDFPIWIIMDALAISASTFAAQNWGAGRHDRVRQSVSACIWIGLIVIIPLSAVLYFAGEALSGIFVRDAEVIRLSGEMIRFYAPFFFTYIWGEVLAGAIRGTGETLKPMIITLVCTCLLRIMWILWLVPTDASILTIIATYPLTWFVTSYVFVVYYLRFRKRLVARPVLQGT